MLDGLPQSDHRQKRAGDQAEGQFQIGVEHVRGDQGDEDAAQGAAKRNHQIKQRQVLRRRLALGQFAMAHHAADEQARGEQRE